ncbi:MAG: 4Fe-4S dicluster domain-containing protein [Deltaproteobacteria bacterium]|nr:4Fe-4S dicluster domain-containing protein [Deltaproteobacteria bacterium]MBW2258590.1 4Fe-4S dicluster domain-containing protein [Deltaproteobacteria bacterium]
MKAHYGYEDGSGRFYLTVDTDLCTGCEDCLAACPAEVFEMVEEDPIDERMVAAVSDAHRKKLKYSCNPCKPSGYTSLPCVAACEPGALAHSW